MIVLSLIIVFILWDWSFIINWIVVWTLLTKTCFIIWAIFNFFFSYRFKVKIEGSLQLFRCPIPSLILIWVSLEVHEVFRTERVSADFTRTFVHKSVLIWIVRKTFKIWDHRSPVFSLSRCTFAKWWKNVMSLCFAVTCIAKLKSSPISRHLWSLTINVNVMANLFHFVPFHVL